MYYIDRDNRYYDSLQAIAEDYENDPDRPLCARKCRPDKFVYDGATVIDDIENYLADNHYEDAADHIVARQELIDFMNAWSKKQIIVSYTPTGETVGIPYAEQKKGTP